MSFDVLLYHFNLVKEKFYCICNRPKSNPLSEPLTIDKFANDLIVKRLCVIVGCHRVGRIGSYWLLSSWCHKLWTGAIGLLLLCSALAILFTLNLATMSGNSRSREFPGIPASNSRPESREWNLPLAFPFPKMGMEFSICIPVPVNGNEIFLGFPGNFPGFPGNFPFPKVGNGIFYLFAFPFPKMEMEFAISRSHSRSPKVIPAHPWEIAKIPVISNFAPSARRPMCVMFWAH